MTEQTMRIDDALSRSVLAIEKGAAALERIANELEDHRKGADAARGQLEQTTRQLERGLQMVTALMASVAGAVDQAAEEKKDDEGQRPQPVAVEAPAKPEPAAKAEPADAAPVEVKQDEEEKPAAKTEAPKPEAPTPEAKAEQAAAPLESMEFIRRFRAIQAEFKPSDELNKEAQTAIAKALNLPRLTACKPEQRQQILDMYRANLLQRA